MVCNISGIAPEVKIAAGMIALMYVLSVAFSLPVIVPSGERAAFVGIHYIYPLMGVALLGIVTFFMGSREVALRYLLAMPCYAVILFAHFNMKLWVPHINSANFDDIFWKTDQYCRLLIDFCIFIRNKIFFFISYQSNFYILSYIAMFYCSFLYHSIKTPLLFGKLIIASFLLQILGTIGYIAFPAVGPFIYEAGVDPIITDSQNGMLTFYRQSAAEGAGWLVHHGSANFTAGLAAMPSLHSASAFLFFLFAWKYGRALLPLYSFILLFIVVTAVASRWHYLIDVPVGMLLAWVSYKIADRLEAAQRRGSSAVVGSVVQPAGA